MKIKVNFENGDCTSNLSGTKRYRSGNVKWRIYVNFPGNLIKNLLMTCILTSKIMKGHFEVTARSLTAKSDTYVCQFELKFIPQFNGDLHFDRKYVP